MPSVPVPSAVVVLHTNMDSVAAFGIDLEFLRYEAAAGEVEALVVGTPDPGCIPGRQCGEPCRDRQHQGRPQKSHEQLSGAHFHLDTVSDPKVPFVYAFRPPHCTLLGPRPTGGATCCAIWSITMRATESQNSPTGSWACRFRA